MSVESIAIALNHSRSTGAAKLVLIGIANHAGDGGAWPAVSTLAKYAGVSPRNVQKWIARLEELGEIRRHIQDGGTASYPDHLRPNRYEFTLTCPATCDRSSRHEVTDAASAWFATEGILIEGPWGVATDTPTPVGSDTPPPVATDTQTVHIQPSNNRPGDRAAARSRRPEPRASESQVRYIEHMQGVLSHESWSAVDNPREMTVNQAVGWIEAWMGDYWKAGGGGKRRARSGGGKR